VARSPVSCSSRETGLGKSGSPVALTEPQRWARVPPGQAWKRPGLPTDWVRVLDRHPDPLGLARRGLPLPGWCWLDTLGKPLHVAEHPGRGFDGLQLMRNSLGSSTRLL
jgi:hypothetical protein